jgi:MFS transporter, DHA1 family, inner membrane transport protein
MTDKAMADQWIGAPPTPLHIGTVLGITVMGGLMASILPILLGGLADVARLNPAQIGQAGSSELLANGVVCGLAGLFLPHRNLRLIGIVAGILLIVANLLTMMTSGWNVVMARAISGVGCGLFMWLLTGLLVRSRNAGRWVGIYVVMLSLTALALSTLFTKLLIPAYGINGGFAALAFIGVVTALASWLLPRAFSPLEQADAGNGGLPAAPGLCALLAQFSYIAGLIAVWFYVGSMGKQSGTDQADVDLAFSIAFGLQIAGGLAATWLSNRLRPLFVILASGTASLGIALAVTAGIVETPYVIIVAIFGGLWMFAAAYLIPFSIAIDPTMRTAMLTTATQSMGSAAGPAIASVAIATGDVRGALWVGAVAFGLAMVAALAASYLASKRTALA